MDLKRAFFNWRFLLAVFIMWILMLLTILPVILLRGISVTWDYIFQYAVFGNFELIFYMCAVFPYSNAFLEDFQEGYGIFLLSRGQKEKYALSKCMAVLFSAIGVIVIVFFSFFAFVRVIFPDSGNKMDSAYVVGRYISWLDMGGGIVYVTSRVLLTGLVSAMFALIVLTASIYIHDVLIVNALPLLVFYFISNLGVLLNIPDKFDLLVLSYGNADVGTELVNYLYSIGVFLLLIILISKLFIRQIKERVWV